MDVKRAEAGQGARIASIIFDRRREHNRARRICRRKTRPIVGSFHFLESGALSLALFAEFLAGFRLPESVDNRLPAQGPRKTDRGFVAALSILPGLADSSIIAAWFPFWIKTFPSRRKGDVFDMSKKSLKPAFAIFLSVALCSCSGRQPSEAKLSGGEISVRIMTFNLLVGGVQRGEPLERSAEVIRAGDADIVALQETAVSAPLLARKLGYNLAYFGFDKAILSRFPIVETSDDGARIEVSPGREIVVFVAHLAPYPYGPYDLRDDPTLTEEKLVSVAEKARGRAAERYLGSARPLMEDGDPVFLAGDFNEPSSLDWTEQAARSGLVPMPVAWPVSRALLGAGLRDSYREVHPDPVENPGHTWTPAPGRNEVHDRIDIIYFAGDGVSVDDSILIGPNDGLSEIVVDPYPSDHRALVSVFSLR